MGALRQFLNGHGDSLGKVKAEPHGSEDDQQRHNGQGDEMDGLDRLLEQLELLEFVKPAGKFVEPVDEVSGNEFLRHHKPDDRLGFGSGKDGNDAADQLAVRGRLDLVGIRPFFKALPQDIGPGSLEGAQVELLVLRLRPAAACSGKTPEWRPTGTRRASHR